MSKSGNSMVAVGLEVGPGALFQVFGLGHLYQGRVAAGLAIMFGYWALLAVNLWLVGFWGLGLVTGFVTWIAFLFLSATDVIES